MKSALRTNKRGQDVAMEIVWYPTKLKLDGVAIYILWCQHEEYENVKPVHTDQRGVVRFSNLEDLQEYAEQKGFATEAYVEETSFLNLDEAIASLSGDPDGNSLLSAWNMASDVATSVRTSFTDRTVEQEFLYDKLFASANLIVELPVDRPYLPQWSDLELGLMRRTMTEGISIIWSSCGLS